MKIINLEQFKTSARGAVAKPIIRLRTNGQISITKRVVTTCVDYNSLEKDEKGNNTIHVAFAEDEDGQLHLKISNARLAESIQFVEKDGLFFKSNVKLSLHLIAYTKSESKSIPCLIQVSSKNEEGWMPVITTYWKTL